MNNVSKRILSLLLALTLALSNVTGFAPTAFAEETEVTEAALAEPVALEESAEEAEPAAEEPAEEPIEEPIEEPAEEPVEEPAEETVEEPAEEPVEEPAEEPVEEPAEEPAEGIIEEPAEGIVEEPAEGIVEEPAEGAAEEIIELAAEGIGELSVDGIEMSVTSTLNSKNDVTATATWIAGGTTIEGVLTQPSAANASKTILTLKNIREEDAVLSFDWEASTVANNAKVTSRHYAANGTQITTKQLAKGTQSNTESGFNEEYTLAPGGYVEIELYSPKVNGGDTTKVKLKNLKLYVDAMVTTTFLPVDPAQGSYKVDGSTITEETTFTQKARETYELEAIPADGYVFSGWFNGQTFVSTEANASLQLDSDQSVYPLFVQAEEAVWAVGEACFLNLEDAIVCAENGNDHVVVLLKDFTLEEDTVIPKDVVLLVPFDEENTCYLETPAPEPNVDTDNDGFKNDPAPWQTPYAYRTLTVGSGVELKIEGSLSVSAVHHGGQANVGTPTGPCGFVQTGSNSMITVANGGSLYAWGYVVGSGKVEAMSGGSVYENIQITDFRGGSASSQFMNTDQSVTDEEELAKYVVMPFSQYYVQNIEIPLTIRQGAKEIVYTTIYAANANNSLPIEFIGTEKSMFRMGSGASITKRYNSGSDRLVIDVDGDMELRGMTVKAVMGTTEYEVETVMFNLPITNNITINVNSGTTTVAQNVALHAGAEVNIAQDACLMLDSDYNLFAYDRDEWMSDYFCNNNTYFKPIVWSYANGRTSPRSNDDLVDAKINVNGEIDAWGYLYTTQGGANIYSSQGTGKVILEVGNGDLEKTWQATQNGTQITHKSIPVTPVQLKNADGSYTTTESADENGSIYLYDAVSGIWEENATVTFHANGGMGSMESIAVSNMEVYNEENEITLPANGFISEYVFKEWNTKADGTGESYRPGVSFYVTGNVTLYAIWDKPAEYTVTWNVEGVTSSTTVVAGKVPSYGATNPSKAAEGCTSYTFAGWATSADGEAKTELPAANGPVTYYAIFTSKTEHSFTNKKGDEITAGNCKTEAVYALKCDNCDAVHETETIKGEKVADKHTGNNTVVGKVDATCGADGYTGDTVCECGETIATGTVQPATGLHTYVKGLRGAEKTAGTCKAAAVYAAKCDNCVFENTAMSIYGEKDMGNHVNEAVSYTNLDAEYHKVYWSCCDTVVKAQEKHTYTDGTCVCNKVQTFTVDVDGSFVGFKGGVAPVATYGQDLTVELVNLLPANVTTRDDVFVLDFYYGKDNQGVNITADNGIFVIDKKFITGDITINAVALVEFTVNLQGGTLSELGKEFLAENEGIVTMPDSPYSFYQYEIEFGVLDKYFTRDGYNLASFKDQNGETYAADDIVHLKGDMHLTAVWECLHEETKAVDNGDGKTHKIICTNPECNGTVINAQVAHNFENAEHKCVCGKVESFTVTWVGEDGKIVATETVEYGKDATKAPVVTEKTGYTGKWDKEAKEVKSDLTINPVYTAIEYTLTIYAMDFKNGDDCISNAVEVDVPYGALVKDYLPADCGEEYDKDPIYQPGETITVAGKMYNGTWTITGWLGSDEVSVNRDIDLEIFTMPAGGMEITQSYVFTGWVHNWYDENGDWLEESNGTMYCVADEYIENTIAHIDGDAYLFDENGFIVAGAGLVRHVTEDGTVEYYYFCDAVGCEKGCTEASYTGFKKGIHWLYKDNGLLPQWDYSFDDRGVILHHEDTSLQGLQPNGEEITYYIDGVPAYMGLIDINGDIYYVRSSGNIIRNKSYWISKTNGLMDEGAYTFDQEGKLVVEEEEQKKGIVAENDGLYYYVDGKVAYAGLIEIDGDIYYVRSNGKLAQNQRYWVTKHNGLLKEASYWFDEEGKLMKGNGIKSEDDGLYYYENGARTYAGLIKIGDDYYYVRSSGKLAQNEKYWITKHNGLMLEGSYLFDAEGKLVFDAEPGYTGIKDGYYYKNGMKSYAGLIEIDGELYYVNSAYKVITGRKYWISKTNNLLPEGIYEFDADGKMI